MMAAKRDGRSVMRLERMFRSEIDDKLLHHVAGGPHKGILIAKAVDSKLDTPTKQFVDSHIDSGISYSILSIANSLTTSGVLKLIHSWLWCDILNFLLTPTQ